MAAGFRGRYLDLAAVCNDPDEILYELECHILGNESAPRAKRLNAMVVLMYFFGECDIFKMPPAVPGPRLTR